MKILKKFVEINVKMIGGNQVEPGGNQAVTRLTVYRPYYMTRRADVVELCYCLKSNNRAITILPRGGGPKNF